MDAFLTDLTIKSHQITPKEQKFIKKYSDILSQIVQCLETIDDPLSKKKLKSLLTKKQKLHASVEKLVGGVSQSPTTLEKLGDPLDNVASHLLPNELVALSEVNKKMNELTKSHLKTTEFKHALEQDKKDKLHIAYTYARVGNLEKLTEEFAKPDNDNIEWGKVATHALKYCKLDCLMFLIKHGKEPLYNRTLEHVAKKGCLNVLKYISKIGRMEEFNAEMVSKAVLANDNLKTFKWLIAHTFNLPNNRTKKLEIRHGAIENLVEKGHLQMLKEIYNDFERKPNNIYNYGYYSPFVTESSDACTIAASNGHLELLKWLREKGYIWNTDTLIEAIKHCHLEIIDYILLPTGKPPIFSENLLYSEARKCSKTADIIEIFKKYNIQEPLYVERQSEVHNLQEKYKRERVDELINTRIMYNIKEGDVVVTTPYISSRPEYAVYYVVLDGNKKKLESDEGIFGHTFDSYVQMLEVRFKNIKFDKVKNKLVDIFK